MSRNVPVLLVIMVLGAILRVVGLGAKGLWYDEAVSASFLGFSTLETIRRCAEVQATSPPLYFLVLKAWATIWGDSEIALRLAAVLFGLAAIIGVFALTRELGRFAGDGRGSVPAAFLAAALIALSPLHIQLSQQVRGYSLGAALQAWSGWALLRALRGGPRQGTHWVAASLLAAAACYTHYLAMFTVCAQGLFAGVYLAWNRGRQRSRSAESRIETTPGGKSGGGSRRAGIAGQYRPGSPAGDAGPTVHVVASDLRAGLDGNRSAAPDSAMGRVSNPGPSIGWATVAGAIFSVGFLVPWLTRLLAQAQSVGEDVPHPRVPPSFLARGVTQAVLGNFSSPWRGPDIGDWTVPAILGLLFLILVAWGGWPGWYLILTGLIPPLLMAVCSAFSRWSMTEVRYWSFAQVSWLAAVALLIGRIPHRPERMLLTAWIVGWSAYACFESWDVIGRSSQPGIRAATRFILENRGPDEPIVAQTPYVFFGACYYARGQAKPLLCATAANRESQYGSEQLRDDDLIPLDSLRNGDFPGFWLVSCRSFNPNGILDPNLPARWSLVDAWTFAQDYPWEASVVVKHYVREK